MRLVEQHIINKDHKLYKEIDALAFKSKNLYNSALYVVRQSFIFESKWIHYNEIQKDFQNQNQQDYRNLPSKVAQQTIMNVEQNMKSYFKATKSYKEHPEDFTGKPCLPKYKHKTEGRAVLVYTKQAISKTQLQHGTIALSQTNIRIKSKVKNPLEVRIVKGSYCYIIEVVYEVKEKQEKVNRDYKSAIDLGVNNLAALTNNINLDPLLFNSKPLKSMNQFYNKEKARLQSLLPKNQDYSKRLDKLTHKRNNKIKNYLHNTSRSIINHLVSNNIGTLVIGYNPGWKQEVNLGKVNNQKFVSIPFLKFIQQLEYKAALVGIKTIITEESYTSKCSFLDLEEICQHDEYIGKRKNRLFVSGKGKIIHSDVNGSFNIMRKVFPEEFSNGIEAVVVQPLRRNPYKVNQCQSHN